MCLFLINFPISLGIYSTPKLSRYITLSEFTYNATQWISVYSYSSRFVIHAPSFVLDKRVKKH